MHTRNKGVKKSEGIKIFGMYVIADTQVYKQSIP